MKNYKHLLSVCVLCLGVTIISDISIQAAEAGQVANSTYDRVQVSKQIYGKMFGNKQVELSKTDPGFEKTMDRYIYGDIAHQAKITDKQRALVTLAVLTTNQNDVMLHDQVQGALNLGVTPLEIKETVYQTAPYIGFPKAVEALTIVNTVFKKNGIKMPLPEQGTVTEADRFERGLAVQKGIYGDRIDKMWASTPADLKHIQEDLSAFCFGDTYTRGTLGLKMREMLTLACITTLGGAEPQLKGHIVGNLKVGNDRRTIIATITQCSPYIGFPRTLNAIQCVNQVIPAEK